MGTYTGVCFDLAVLSSSAIMIVYNYDYGDESFGNYVNAATISGTTLTFGGTPLGSTWSPGGDHTTSLKLITIDATHAWVVAYTSSSGSTAWVSLNYLTRSGTTVTADYASATVSIVGATDYTSSDTILTELFSACLLDAGRLAILVLDQKSLNASREIFIAEAVPSYINVTRALTINVKAQCNFHLNLAQLEPGRIAAWGSIDVNNSSKNQLVYGEWGFNGVVPTYGSIRAIGATLGAAISYPDNDPDKIVGGIAVLTPTKVVIAQQMYTTVKDWLGVDERRLAVGIMQEAATTDQVKLLAPKGRTSKIHSSMTIGAQYYLDDTGALTTVQSIYPVGVALNATDLSLT
jgi:hypothetical protein